MKKSTEEFLKKATYSGIRLKDIPDEWKWKLGNYRVEEMVSKEDLLIAFKLEKEK